MKSLICVCFVLLKYFNCSACTIGKVCAQYDLGVDVYMLYMCTIVNTHRPFRGLLRSTAHEHIICSLRYSHNCKHTFTYTHAYPQTDESTAQARGQSSRSSSPTCTLAIPPRLSMLCELLVFVKNLELTSSTQLATQAERRGSK